MGRQLCLFLKFTFLVLAMALVLGCAEEQDPFNVAFFAQEDIESTPMQEEGTSTDKREARRNHLQCSTDIQKNRLVLRELGNFLTPVEVPILVRAHGARFRVVDVESMDLDLPREALLSQASTEDYLHQLEFSVSKPGDYVLRVVIESEDGTRAACEVSFNVVSFREARKSIMNLRKKLGTVPKPKPPTSHRLPLITAENLTQSGRELIEKFPEAVRKIYGSWNPDWESAFDFED